MIRPRLLPVVCLCLVSSLCLDTVLAQRQMESLGRGLVALRSSSTQVYVGWRLLGNDPRDVAFNLYRSANGGAAVKVNASPLTATTDYVDTPGSLSTTAYTYSVKPVIGGVEVPDAWAHASTAPVALPVNPPTRQYVPVPMQPTPDGALDVKFCWVGDLDGDGEFDFVVDRQSGEGFRQFLDAYKRDGTLLWRIDLGPNSFYKYNIEPGSSSISIGHGDNVTVYDMDGDGKSEVLLRTANGVVFGDGAVASGGASNNVQFLSVINGMTGAELARATVPNPRLADGPMNGHMGILYLDGQRPSVVWASKNRASDESFHGVITAWNWRGGSINQLWSWVDGGSLHAPEGHQIRIADVDNDGKDEFVDIGYVLDDNGTQLFNIPEIVHGDRFHLTDIDPDRPGLENYIIQQNNGSGLATALYNAGTGAMIKKWYAGGVVDVGRGVAGDFDPAVKGCEMFSTMAGIYDCKGNQLNYANRPFPPEAIWWDGDLVREFVSTIGSSATSPGIDKFNTANGSSGRVISLYSDSAAPNSPYNNYIAYGGRPQFWGDILGDWREELLCAATDNSELRIYMVRSADSAKTSNGTGFRIPTLMHNPQYRCQTTTKGYVQASYVDYYLGTGMTAPPPPPMVDTDLTWRGGAGSSTWDEGVTTSWSDDGVASSFTAGKAVRFDIGANATTPVALVGTLSPKDLTVYSPKDQTFDGALGSLAGTMKLVKSGQGSLTLSGSHAFTGTTTIWDGALILNGTLSNSPITVWGGTYGGPAAAGLTGGRIGGTGTFSQAVTLGYRGAITPGSGMGSAGTVTLGSGLTAQDGSCLAFDLSNNPGNPATSDRIAITGNLSVSGKVGIVIKALNGTVPAGTYTLVTYTGSLTGSAANFDVTVPPGTPYSLSAAAGSVTLTVPVTRVPEAIVWRGSGAVWDLAASQNWLNAGSPDIFVSGDAVTFDATGAANATATLSGALPVASVTVNATTNYTLSGSGSISGSGGLAKSGSGTLTINTANDYTGATTITGGVLAVASLADGGTPSSIGAAGVGASNLVINGGTLRLTGSQTNTNRSMTLGASGGTLDVAANGSSMQISGTITGSGRLTKTGAGTLILANTNTYSGGTTIDGGTIYLAGSNANKNALGGGAVTFNNGTLTMANVQNNDVCNWNLIVPSGMTGRLNADGRCSLTGSLTGSGTFNYYSPYVRSDMKGNWSAFTGQINLATDADGSEMRVTNSFGFGTAALNIGAESYVYYNIGNSNATLDIGELTGDSTTGIGGGPTVGRTTTWRVGGRNTDAIFSGAIVNGTGLTAITKNGTGIWTLAGASTHTGATTVSSGTLRIQGSTTGSAVTVQGGAALGGSGIITGNVSFQSAAILEHGAIGATPLAITGNLTFGTNALVRPVTGITLGPGIYTLLTYSGTLTGTPSLSWQAPPGSTLTASFDLATTGVITMTLAQPPGASDLLWTGNTNSTWDTATANWTDGSGNVIFSAQSTVTFTDSGNATNPVSLALDVEPEEVFVSATKNYTLSGAGRIIGEGTLTKNGSGTLVLSTAHTYTGGTTISGGTLSITNAGALGTGPVTLSGGTWATNALAPQNPILVTAASTVSGGDGGGAHGLRNISGSGILTCNATSVFDFEGDMSGFSGTFALTGVGSFRLFTSTFSGSAAATFDLGNRGLSARQGSAYSLGALKGLTGSFIGMAGNSNAASCTYTIGQANIDSTFAGVIANGSATKLVAITKAGTGSLTLAGTSTYTGATTVNGGRLNVTGSLASTATTVATTGALGGSGSIGGAVTCHGTLAPGTSAGTLALGAGLTLSPTSVLDYELGTVSDRVNVTGNLTLAGTLHVTAGPGFGPGTYTLITYTGTLDDEDGLALGTLPPGYEATVSTATAGQVRLIVTQILTPFEQWQIQHFGSTSDPEAAPPADPDGDGTDNATEFLLSLDPKNGSSSFKATGTHGPGGFTITWPSAVGVQFEVFRSATLEAPWDSIHTTTGTGTTDSFTDTPPPAGNAFYKIAILASP
ncbi:autotransporter-associated beta strand repeat-containing protein [Luteolibacter arcticus]|uniref:Autotransporter-associated beta strand repeat-containing protein n=1 Tax=Luteolibacter arcticus TaxID=1581411 RepID=A0ABT3GND2_9BACT|nr:autotransporter-associated beta strand repeat-containing protein [Luteolibacter arcticus]MCW1924980.1 autotransporter-associated beta strand repeat-containing protein [Luteolibacter arcticus]